MENLINNKLKKQNLFNIEKKCFQNLDDKGNNYKIIVLSILKNHKAEEERSNMWLFLFKKIKCNNENNNLMK